MHSIVFGIQWDFFPLNRHISPTASLSFLLHIYCSCTWMNVLQRADTTYGLYCLCRHISQCGPLYVGTAPTLFPHWRAIEQLGVLRLCVVVLLFSFFAEVVKRSGMVVEGSVKWPARKLENGATRLVVLYCGSAVPPSKQEHCATVGGFKRNNLNTLNYTLHTFWKLHSHRHFTVCCNNKNKINVWIETCWVCITCTCTLC